MATPRLGDGSRAGRHIDALRLALRMALPHLEAQLDSLVECHSTLRRTEGGDIEAVHDTVDEIAAPLVAELERTIATAEAALRWQDISESEVA